MVIIVTILLKFYYMPSAVLSTLPRVEKDFWNHLLEATNQCIFGHFLP